MKTIRAGVLCAVLVAFALVACGRAAPKPQEMSEPGTEARQEQQSGIVLNVRRPEKVHAHTQSGTRWEAPQNEPCKRCETGTLVLQEQAFDWATKDFALCQENPNFSDRLQDCYVIQKVICDNPDCLLIQGEQTVTQTRVLCTHE